MATDRRTRQELIDSERTEMLRADRLWTVLQDICEGRPYVTLLTQFYDDAEGKHHSLTATLHRVMSASGGTIFLTWDGKVWQVAGLEDWIDETQRRLVSRDLRDPELNAWAMLWQDVKKARQEEIDKHEARQAARETA